MKKFLRWIVVIIAAIIAGIGIMMLIGIYMGGQLDKENTSNEFVSHRASQATHAKEPEVSDIDIHELWTGTNSYRNAAGANSVSQSPHISETAKAKCEDMVNKNYWSHTSPDGTKFWDIMKNKGISYSEAGENLAQGHTSATSILASWMGSQTHKDNLLKPEYQEVGFAVCKSSNFNNNGVKLIVVQHFIAK